MPHDKRFGILRFINYKETSLEGLDRIVRYIRDPSASPLELQHHSFLSRRWPVEDFEAIEERYRRHGGRLYKQCVLSFGCIVNDENVQAAFDMVKMLMETYRGQYPYIVALHTNVAARLHAHVVMGMTNIKDGSKFNQSPDELRLFQRRYNELADKMGFPRLKQAQAEDAAALSDEAEAVPEDEILSIEPMLGLDGHYSPIVLPYEGNGQPAAELLPQQSQQVTVDVIAYMTKRFYEDCVYYYEAGRGQVGGMK